MTMIQTLQDIISRCGIQDFIQISFMKFGKILDEDKHNWIITQGTTYLGKQIVYDLIWKIVKIDMIILLVDMLPQYRFDSNGV